MLNISETKEILFVLINKLENNTLDKRETEALENLLIELNQKGETAENYLSNKEFLSVFYLATLMYKKDD